VTDACSSLACSYRQQPQPAAAPGRICFVPCAPSAATAPTAHASRPAAVLAAASADDAVAVSMPVLLRHSLDGVGPAASLSPPAALAATSTALAFGAPAPRGAGAATNGGGGSSGSGGGGGGGTSWAVIVTLAALGIVICYADRSNMSTAIIPMSQDFGWDKAYQGVVLSAFFLGYAATQILGGARAAGGPGEAAGRGGSQAGRVRGAAAPGGAGIGWAGWLCARVHQRAGSGGRCLGSRSSSLAGACAASQLQIAPPPGTLADRYGGKAVLAAGVALWSLFTGLTPQAAAGGAASLLAARVLLGVGEGVAFPAVHSLIGASQWGAHAGSSRGTPARSAKPRHTRPPPPPLPGPRCSPRRALPAQPATSRSLASRPRWAL
jgi:hypothetical protein